MILVPPSIVGPNEPDLQNSVLGLLPQKRLCVNCINLREKKKKKAVMQNRIYTQIYHACKQLLGLEQIWCHFSTTS